MSVKSFGVAFVWSFYWEIFFVKHTSEGMKKAGRYNDGIKSLGSSTGIVLILEKHLECGERRGFYNLSWFWHPPVVCSCCLLWII